MDSILTRLNRARRVAGTTFGVKVRPWIVGWLFLNLRVLVAVGQALDPLFFPRLKQTRVTRPIVLVGNPRTGTTFLQRFLSDHGIGAGLELYRMLYPSLLLQKVLTPMLPLLERISPAKYHNTAAHETSLSSVETDDVGVLFRYFDGFFLYGFFLAFDDQDLLREFEPSTRDTSARDFDWLEQLWARSMVAHDTDRVVAKLFSLGPRLPAFTARFPEASILYLARDPIDIIPSGMSLVTGVLDSAFGFWKLPEPVQRRYLDRLYVAFVELLRRFHADWSSGAIPHDRVYIVRYDRMMSDFETVMDEILAHIGHEPDAALLQAIGARGMKQRSYKSGHKYDLQKFGLDAEQIRTDCAFFYQAFLPPLP